MTRHYPETLRRWRDAFSARAGEAAELGYDRRFRRLWEMYLCYVEAGFRERRIGVVQELFAAEHAVGDGIEEERRPTRGELGERGPAAGAEHMVA